MIDKIHKTIKIRVTFLGVALVLIKIVGGVVLKIIYSRQSLDKKDSISIESQIEHCKGQILPGDTEQLKIIQDKGYSGKNTRRPGFEEMMEYINSGVVSQIIVYKLDRISRSILDFAEMMSIFNKHGVDFISATEKFDTSTPTGRAMISIIMVFAQLERETIQQRITDNYYSRGKIGMYLGGPPPYGFVKNKTLLNGKKTSVLEQNPDTIKILTDIYNMYGYTDCSLGKIAQKLNLENIPSPNGAPWDNSKISRILRNPVYVKADVDIYNYYKTKGCDIENDIEDYLGVNACYLYGKRTTNERKYTDVSKHKLSLALHEGVIDSKTFLLCQYKLDKNRQVKRSGAGKSTWLSGLMRCSFCGYAMNVTLAYVNKEKGKIQKIVCGGRKLHIPCEREILSYDLGTIESYVETELKKLIQEMKDVEYEKASAEEKQSREENLCRIEIEKIDKKIDALLESVADGNELTAQYINKKIAELDSIKAEFVNKLNELNNNKVHNSKIVEVSSLSEKWDELDIEEKKTVARYFIKSIEFRNDEINIKWRLLK